MFIGNEIVSSQKTPKLLRDDVKKNFDPPKKPIKGYIVRMKIDKNEKDIISISCVQVTINEKLIVKALDGDEFQTLTYTKDELLKNSFKISHLKKLMKAIRTYQIKSTNSFISITELLNISK